MTAKSIGRRLNILWVGTTLAACALAIQPAALHAGDPQSQQSYGMETPEPASGGGWIGVGTQEVNADKAKDLKLASEYGALIADVDPEGPASKAGIKKGDVITEYNGQRIEGTRELRRLVRETPPGHTAKISIWRDGHAQTVSLEVGSMRAELGARKGPEQGFGPAPPDFGPKPGGPGPDGPTQGGMVPRAPMPGQFGFRGMPANPFEGNGMGDRRAMMAPPALGVAAQDLSGQLGNYFGAPDGEGVLVTDVPANSLGGKAGLKSGDVITQVDGQRVRNVGELRDHLRDKQRQGESVKLDIVRKGAPVSVSVQLEKPPAPPSPGANRRAIPL
jgi:C-terminal processing protease CtpA/Prc